MATGYATDEIAAGSRPREWWAYFRISPLVAALAAILLILIVPPTWFLIEASVHTTRPDGSFDQFTLRYFQQVFSSS